MFGLGVRSVFTATRFALPGMLQRGRGLIVATQERPGDDERFAQNLVVDAAVAATQRMVRYLAQELEDQGITALLVYLGWVRSVNMGMGFDPEAHGMSREDLHRVTQSTHLVGRAIASLAADPEVATRSGRTLYGGRRRPGVRFHGRGRTHPRLRRRGLADDASGTATNASAAASSDRAPRAAPRRPGSRGP